MRQHAEEVQDAIMGMDRPDYSRPRGEPLIFVVEDDELQGEAVSCILQEWGYHVRLFGALSDFGVALKGAAQRGEPPAAVVMDMAFPEGDLAGAETLRELRQVHGEALPPVLFLSMRQDLDARLAAYRSGSVSYLKKPVEARCLLRQLDAITRRLPSEPYRVLMVEDEALILEAQTAVLRGAGMAVTALTEPRRALEQIDAIDPEVIVLDLHMPDISGAELAALLREEARYQEVPIVFLSGEVDEDWQVGALNQGGDEFLSKPVEPDHLSSRVASWARRSRELRHRREQLQAMLREREQEHQALNHHAIVSIADAAGNITYVNDMFCRISGYAREELLGGNHRMLKSGAHPDSLYREMWETIASGRVWHGEICNRRKDGGFYWVESTITPFVDEAGLPYQYVSLRTDITKRMRVEQMAEKARERLRLGQLYANIGTWEWDLVSGDVFWSERIAPLFGYPAGDLETTYDNFLGAVHPDDRQAVVDAVGACIENDTPYEIEHRVVWPDGTVRWLMERGAVQRDAEGNALMMIGVVQDID
ncbi:MAG: PAS domain-containing protein, partial [Pseudomonadota bacterium]